MFLVELGQPKRLHRKPTEADEFGIHTNQSVLIMLVLVLVLHDIGNL